MDKLVKEILTQFIDSCVKDVQKAVKNKSDKLPHMVESEIIDTGAKITVPYWFSVFQDGRRPGTFPPYSVILQW